MKILHIITRLILGGAQQNTVLTCAAQVRAGHSVCLVYGPIYGPEGSLLDDALASGAQVICVPSLRRAVLPPHDVRCYRALRSLIRKIRPDVVHTHSSKAGILGRAAAWREKVPAVIHTIHGLPFHNRQSCIERGLYVAAERWAARRCHRIVGVTRAMCDAFADHRIGRPQQFDVVPSGVDLRFFEISADDRNQTRRTYGLAPDATVVGITARLDRFKGHDDLLDVLPGLIEREPNLHLLFVGDGYHRGQLEARIGDAQLADRVVFTGLVPLAQVPALYRAMDVLVLPSYQEGQPRTLVEALMSGCPIVGYDAGGIGEICIDAKTGRLVPVGDKSALADAIMWMLDHPVERRQLVEGGQEHARRHFSVENMVGKLEQIYADCLKNLENRPIR